MGRMLAPNRLISCLAILCACGPSMPATGQEGGGSGGGSTSTTTGSATTGSLDTSTTTAVDTSSSTTEASPSLCPPPEQTFEQRSEPCRGGIALTQIDDAGPTGLAQCPDGSVHSYGVACCGADAFPTCPGPGTDGTCAIDADCAEYERAECRSSEVFGNISCRCFSGVCVTDADCDAGQACLCAGDPAIATFEVARCVPAECRTDADCDGFRCGLSGHPCAFGYELHCHTANDECERDGDCDENSFCGFAPDTARWVCVSNGPPCD